MERCPWCGSLNRTHHTGACRNVEVKSNSEVALNEQEAILVTAAKKDADKYGYTVNGYSAIHDPASASALQDRINNTSYGTVKAMKKWVHALWSAIEDA